MGAIEGKGGVGMLSESYLKKLALAAVTRWGAHMG